MAAISLPANREALFLSLYETDLPDGVIFRLAARARPAILLTTAESEEDEIPLGASKDRQAEDITARRFDRARVTYQCD
ncbi:hypothetical protein K6M90_16050 [Rhizobium sp. 9T]|uniref:hypothetical protein n=1 Tax=Rhizobium croatiense TaxID=2867516 RepID=UPI001C9368E4|nr:hypothetical protein [Rhizobium croatiense]MBY4609162.1 hypothetical protein [Rhizobium croatiense]